MTNEHNMKTNNIHYLLIKHINQNNELIRTIEDSKPLQTTSEIYARINTYEESWKKEGFEVVFYCGTYYRFHNSQTGEDRIIYTV